MVSKSKGFTSPPGIPERHDGRPCGEGNALGRCEGNMAVIIGARAIEYGERPQ